MNQKHLSEFLKAYNFLKAKSNRKFCIQMFYHDSNSEPFLTTESDVERVILDYEENDGMIITVITPEILLSLSIRNYLAHVDDSYVSFGSNHDKETYCIIEFC